MPRVIPSQQAASDIKKAADGDVETMSAFTGLEMQETVMGKKTVPYIVLNHWDQHSEMICSKDLFTVNSS